MRNPVLLSTGAFTGRRNGRNFKLALEYADLLDCDGFEFLFFEDFYPYIDTLVCEYRAAGLNVPVVHAEKSTGDLLDGDAAHLALSLERFRVNCDAGARLGCAKVVLHAWGYPMSDGEPDRTCGVLARFREIAREYALELVVENVVCIHGSPLAMLRRVRTAYPEQKFLIDTRHAQFHRELPETLDDDIMASVRHLHLADFHGGYMDWEHRSAGIALGAGDVDWPLFFGKLRALGYGGTVTIEAAAILERGVDVAAQNRNIAFVRAGLCGK